jgi:uncharacterized protein
MQCDQCDQQATIHVTFVGPGKTISQKHLCGECANRNLNEPRPSPEKTGHGSPNALGEIEIEVDKVIISETHDQQVIVFREVQGCRQLPLICGIFEATQADRTLHRIPSPRPLTHDAWLASIEALGAKVVGMCIRDYDERTHIFFADLRLAHNSKEVIIDARPSDAVAVALKVGAPMFAAERVLKQLM